MAVRKKKPAPSHAKQIAINIAAIATASALGMFGRRGRRQSIAKAVGRMGKSAATVMAAKEVLAEAPAIAKMAADIASRTTSRRASRKTGLLSWINKQALFYKIFYEAQGRPIEAWAFAYAKGPNFVPPGLPKSCRRCLTNTPANLQLDRVYPVLSSS